MGCAKESVRDPGWSWPSAKLVCSKLRLEFVTSADLAVLVVASDGQPPSGHTLLATRSLVLQS